MVIYKYRIEVGENKCLTRGFEKPFDKIMVKTMQETTKYLCENIQGCVFARLL